MFECHLPGLAELEIEMEKNVEVVTNVGYSSFWR